MKYKQTSRPVYKRQPFHPISSSLSIHGHGFHPLAVQWREKGDRSATLIERLSGHPEHFPSVELGAASTGSQSASRAAKTRLPAADKSAMAKAHCVIFTHLLGGLATEQGGADCEEKVSASLCALSYWLDQLQSLPDLQPLGSHLTLYCAPKQLSGARAWAHLNGLAEADICTHYEGVTAGQLSVGAAIIWIDASKIYGAGFHLNELLSLMKLRKKPIASYCSLSPEKLQARTLNAEPIIIAEKSSCPRLAASSVHLGSSPERADGESDSTLRSCISGFGEEGATYLAPVFCFEAFRYPSMNESSVPGADLILQGEDWHGVEVPEFWSFESWSRRQREDLKETFRKLRPREDLPERFRKADLWSYDMKISEHPVYQTSYGVLGRKPPSQHDLVTVYKGIKGGLDGIEGSKSRRTGLRTGLRKSKVQSSHSLGAW